jgi:predicted AlkP superfamily pyrophosphatase or phosphodiesterase
MLIRRRPPIVWFVAWCFGCVAVARGQSRPTTVAAPIPPDHTTVVWVSIDGFRHDYLERFRPATLCRLRDEGAFTTREQPIFPSLTFPNHVAQVTGVGVSGHGIPMNSFLDEANGQTYNFPDLAELLRAEPIWVTAERQGVRTACVDWPMSHGEAGPVRAAYFDATFDTDETDAHRLGRIVDLLNADHGPHPYRLIMGYMSWVDHVGHSAGPESPRIGEAVAQADRDAGQFLAGVIAWFKATHRPDDELVVMFTTDHGMTAVKHLVSLDRLIGADLVAGIEVVTSGPVATIHTGHAPPGRADQIVKRLAQYPFLTAWKAADVPAADHFADPTRIGQVVVMLKPGYSLTRQRLATTLPVPRDAGGMHGFDPVGCPDMQGSAVVWRLRRPIGGRDLGPVDNTQWDATVCRLLGVRPPPAADPRAVPIP